MHVPFCESLCYYCACNRIITRDRARSGPYLDQLEREVDLVVGHLGRRVRVEQMHWGGGSPTFLNRDELTRLARMMRERFAFADDGTMIATSFVDVIFNPSTPSSMFSGRPA